MLNIDYNESYEIDPINPQKDIAMLVDSRIKKIWLRGTEIKYTQHRVNMFKAILNLILKNGIFSTDEIAATNGLQQEPKSVTRFLQRINKLLKDNDIFIAAPEKHHYYLNAQGFYQNIIII